MLERLPDSMWSMRCEIGWPTTICVPGTLARSARSAARKSSLLRSPIFSVTSISEADTSMACGSPSARPVRRAVATTSGCDSRMFSTMRPRRSDSSSEVPGSVAVPTVSVPSLKSGRKARPAKPSATSATASVATLTPATVFQRVSVASSTRR